MTRRDPRPRKPTLSQRLEAVRELHQPDAGGWCLACDHRWPCDTIETLDSGDR